MYVWYICESYEHCFRSRSGLGREPPIARGAYAPTRALYPSLPHSLSFPPHLTEPISARLLPPSRALLEPPASVHRTAHIRLALNVSGR